MGALSLELGNRSPGSGFTRLKPSMRLDGLQDGIHTGGVWASPDGCVWKPLDCLPWPNATARYPTLEAECYEDMAGMPGFPRNWHIERQNGRRWIVRPFCHLWPQERDLLFNPPRDLIEHAIFALNKAGWEYSDPPQLAYDPIHYVWFLMDCSAAHKPKTWVQGWHGDRDRVIQWYNQTGQTITADLRRRGRRVHHAVQLPSFQDTSKEPYSVQDALHPLTEAERQTYVYVYASCNRPMSYVWADMRTVGIRYLNADTSKPGHVHTWVVANHALDEDTIRRYELTFAYKPWP